MRLPECVCRSEPQIVANAISTISSLVLSADGKGELHHAERCSCLVEDGGVGVHAAWASIQAGNSAMLLSTTSAPASLRRFSAKSILCCRSSAESDCSVSRLSPTSLPHSAQADADHARVAPFGHVGGCIADLDAARQRIHAALFRDAEASPRGRAALRHFISTDHHFWINARCAGDWLEAHPSSRGCSPSCCRYERHARSSQCNASTAPGIGAA